MSKDDPDPSDAMPDVSEADIESLLEQTSQLAAKTGEEVGSPPAQPAAEAPAPPAAPDAESDDDVSDKLAELENLLGEMSGAEAESQDAQTPEPPANAQKDEPQAPPPAEALPSPDDETTDTDSPPVSDPMASPGIDVSDADDFDDFDITVDLGDDAEKAAEKEIAEKLSAGRSGAVGDELPVVDRLVTAPIDAATWFIETVDRPFAKSSPLTKQIIGYVALATLALSVGSMIYTSVAR